MTTEESMELNNLPYERSRSRSPLYLFLTNFLRVPRAHGRPHNEPTKEQIRNLVAGVCRADWPNVSEGIIEKLANRYWEWDKHTYTTPEEREWRIYWKEFRQFVHKLGIGLKSFDKAGSFYLDSSELQKFFIGCYLIAEDRAPSFVIHGCYRVVASKVLGILHEAVHLTSVDESDDRIKNLGHDPNDIKLKLFEVLFESERDTVGEASAVIQIMLYMQDDADLWIPYILGIEGEEFILMLRRVLDALLEMILGKDKVPMEYFTFHY